MSEPKAKCTTCGCDILVRTAERNGGLCTPCKNNVDHPPVKYVYQPSLPLSRAELDDFIISKPAEFVIEALFDPACDKVNFRPHEMTEGDEIVYTVWTLLGEVCNGGFTQYLTNQSGGFAHRCGPSLRAIGAPDYAELIDEALSRFTTKAALPRSEWEDEFYAFWKKNNDPFADLDKRFYALRRANEDELTNRLYAHICANREVFAPYGVGD